MTPRRRPFVVGRRTARSTTLVLCPPAALLRGPWTVCAVVADADRDPPSD